MAILLSQTRHLGKISHLWSPTLRPYFFDPGTLTSAIASPSPLCHGSLFTQPTPDDIYQILSLNTTLTLFEHVATTHPKAFSRPPSLLSFMLSLPSSDRKTFNPSASLRPSHPPSLSPPCHLHPGLPPHLPPRLHSLRCLLP